jgi:hypothetical protein
VPGRGGSHGGYQRAISLVRVMCDCLSGEGTIPTCRRLPPQSTTFSE